MKQKKINYKICLSEAAYKKIEELIDADGNIGDDNLPNDPISVKANEYPEGTPPPDTDDFMQAVSQKRNYYNGWSFQGAWGTSVNESKMAERVYSKEDLTELIDKNKIPSANELSQGYQSADIEADLRNLTNKVKNVSIENRGDVLAIILKELITSNKGVKITPQFKKEIINYIK